MCGNFKRSKMKSEPLTTIISLCGNFTETIYFTHSGVYEDFMVAATILDKIALCNMNLIFY